MSGYFYTIIDKGKTTESSPTNKGTYITRKNSLSLIQKLNGFHIKTTELRNVNKLFYILICQEDYLMTIHF